jgi:hypothetical protein
VDGPSVTLIYTTLPQSLRSLTNGAAVVGFQVTSATAGIANVPPFNDAGTPYANTRYSNSLSITANDVEELQVSNGKFTTPGGQTHAYLNYATYYYTETQTNTANYSNIPTTGYRYATFAWRVTAANPNVYTALEFHLHNTSGVTITNSLAYAGPSPIQLYYRIEDISRSDPVDSSKYSSAWINGNTLSGTVTSSGNYFLPTSYTSTPNSGLVVSVTNESGYTNFPVFIPPLNISAQTINIYCRIGLPMGVPFSFSHISAVLSY